MVFIVCFTFRGWERHVLRCCIIGLSPGCPGATASPQQPAQEKSRFRSDQQQTISNHRHYIMTLSGLSATLTFSLSFSLSVFILFVFLLHPTGQGRWPLSRAGVCPEFLPTRELFTAAVAYACFGGFCWFLFLWKRFDALFVSMNTWERTLLLFMQLYCRHAHINISFHESMARLSYKQSTEILMGTWKDERERQ